MRKFLHAAKSRNRKQRNSAPPLRSKDILRSTDIPVCVRNADRRNPISTLYASRIKDTDKNVCATAEVGATMGFFAYLFVLWIYLAPNLLHAQQSSAAPSNAILPSGFPADLEERLKQERLRDLVQTMNVTLNDDDYTFKGTARVEFLNNTPDTLRQIFFHAHFNAFQPNSLTHKRVAAIGPNRMKPETFANLKPNEYGKLDILSGTANGSAFTVERLGTIIRVDIAKPLLPQERITLDFTFEGQVPIQIRRSGRNNSQGVRYSMAQWFPKLCQYDQHGWQNNQFVLREFYGVWGKYDVKLTVPAKLVVGASGDLQNPLEVGHGYEFDRDTVKFPAPDAEKPQGTKTWHFVAFPVHDFAWVADADYIHRVVKMPATSPISPNLTFHILTKPKFEAVWKNAPEWLPRIFRFNGEKYHPYPYKQFTCAQAGDGGMEYPNLVMIRSGDYNGTLGTVAHEATHQWFYGLAANNETKHAWMDEGITDYLTDRIMAEEFKIDEQSRPTWLDKALVPRRKDALETNRSFLRVYALGYDEPLSIPQDRMNEDMTAVMVYRKASSMLRQFEYSFGKDKVDELLRTYQQRWRFRHPYPPDFEKIGSEVFGQRMDEVFDTFIRGTELPDYTLQSLRSEPTGDMRIKHTLRLSKFERAHVPLRLFATDVKGNVHTFFIPSDITNVSNHDSNQLAPWFWVAPDYTAEFVTTEALRRVQLDTAGNLLRHDLTKNSIQSPSAFPNLPDVQFGFMTRFDEAMPLDYYGVSVRPSVWYDPLGGLQVGVRADAFGGYNNPKITLGAYYNLGNRRFDWQVGVNQMLGSGDSRSTLVSSLFSMDGVTGWTNKWIFDRPPVRSSRQGFAITKLMLDFYQFQDSSYSKYINYKFLTLRLGAIGEYRWKSGFFQAELSITDFARIPLRLEWLDKIIETPIADVQARLFGFSFLEPINSSPNFNQFAYALNTGTMADLFENIPARFMRFASYMNLPVFTQGGGGFVRTPAIPANTIISANLSVGNKSLKSMGLSFPIIEAIKPSIWSAFGFGIFPNTYDRAFIFDSGIAFSINLADIAPESRLLWMFKDEVSLTAYIPLITGVPGQNWIVGYDGVRLGVSTTIPR